MDLKISFHLLLNSLDGSRMAVTPAIMIRNSTVANAGE